MNKKLKVLKLSIVSILLFITNIPCTFILFITIAFAGSMAVDYHGLKGLIRFIDSYIFFILINSLLYFIFRALYNWAGKE